MVFPLYGLRSASTFPPFPSRHFPPIYCWFSLANWFISALPADFHTLPKRLTAYHHCCFRGNVTAIAIHLADTQQFWTVSHVLLLWWWEFSNNLFTWF